MLSQTDTHAAITRKHHRSKSCSLGVFVTLVALMLTGCATTSSSKPTSESNSVLANIKKAGVLTAGTINGNAPWSTVGPNGKPVGWEVDLIEALGKKIGVKVSWQIVSTPGRISVVNTGKADIVAADVTINAERAKAVTFSDPYILIPSVFLVRTDTDLKTIDDLNQPSVTVCAPGGGVAITYVPPVLPKAQMMVLPTVPDCLSAIKAGQAQVQALDVLYNRALMAAEPGKYREILNPSHPDKALPWYEPQAIGLTMQKGHPDWAAYVNAFLKSYESSGQMATTFKKWFGFPMPAETMPKGFGYPN
jgi:polar amino acid transport system substrate-binding protein